MEIKCSKKGIKVFLNLFFPHHHAQSMMRFDRLDLKNWCVVQTIYYKDLMNWGLVVRKYGYFLAFF